MNNQSNLIYALKDGSIVSVGDVESGLKCNCVCPSCGERLVARKGKKRIHHFAHYSGTSCEYGYETSLHLAAKDILSTAEKMIIPSVYVNFPSSGKKAELICDAKEISIEKVDLEKNFDNIIPDVVVYAGGKMLFVEIYVTHCIDETKLKKLKEARISTIEIDLSKKRGLISVEELKSLLLGDSPEKKWMYNRVAEDYYGHFVAYSDKKDIIARGLALHVDQCPTRARVWRGKPYANFYDDCIGCKYFIANCEDSAILCSGRKRVATVKDLSIPEVERIKISDRMIEEQKEKMVMQGNCPYCGSSLIERLSKYGTFWYCSNYPHCIFKASIDPQTGEFIMKM